uniref:Uncharacterized protein n=1 Tax=Acrobeloides nanus TaxID=290746 RepID=A0A914DW06_9BILA
MLAVYFLTTTNSPSDVKWMLKEEKEYLQQALGESSPKERPKNIPWFSLLTCVPIMACYACYFAYGMGQTMLQFYIPIIFKEILFLPIQQNGLYCAVVNIVAIAFKIVWSILMHKLNQKYFSTTTTCKISQTFSLVLSVVCCVLAGHLSNCQQPWISLLLFCGIAMGNGAAMNGFYVSMVSLAPRYTFIISSGGRMCAMLSQLLTPIIVSMFRAEGSLEEWRNIFYVMAAISLFSSIFYVAIGKYDVQEWALVESSQNKIQPKISIVITEEDLNKKSSEEKSQRLEGA